MKKILVIAVAALMLFAIACSRQPEANVSDTDAVQTGEQEAQQPQEQAANEPEKEETTEPVEAEPTEPEKEEVTEPVEAETTEPAQEETAEAGEAIELEELDTEEADRDEQSEAYTSGKDTETPEIDMDTYTIVGGWEIAGVGSDALPEDAAAAFRTVTETLLGATYRPIAYLGSQVVAGTNYAILCTRTLVTAEPTTDLAVLTVYVDLNGGAELLNIADFTLDDYVSKEDAGTPAQLMGGWQAPEEAEELTSMPQDAATAYSAAFDGFVGNSLTPVAYLGKQIVSGTNFAFLCHSTLVTEEPVVSMQVVVINQDLEGNATLTNIVTVDPADFN